MLKNHSNRRIVHCCDTRPTQNAVHVVDGVLVSTPTPVFVSPNKKIPISNYSLSSCASRGELNPVNTAILNNSEELEFSVESARASIDSNTFINE